MDLKEKENIEINWWRDSKFENPQKFTKLNFLKKIQEAQHLDYKLRKYRNRVLNKRKILEIGAGQGWASCFLKKYFLPQAYFTVTDISPYAIESLKYWESIYEVQIDERFESKSYEINAEDESFDLIFCYASAHHFVEHKKSLKELKRILTKDGCIIYMYEPTSSKLFYPLHLKYVTSKHSATPEDILIPADLKKIAKELDLKSEHYYDPHQTIIRSVFLGIYFRFLKMFPFVQRLLPSSSDFIFMKQ